MGTAGPAENGCRDSAAVFPGDHPGRLHACHFTPGSQLRFPDSDARAARVSSMGTRRKTCDLITNINH